MNSITIAFLTLLIGELVFKLYLNLRQNLAINNSYNIVPAPFDKTISLEEHQKAGNYTKLKLKLNQYELIYTVILTILSTLGGGIDQIIYLTNMNNYPMLSQILLIISFIIISSVLGMPFKLYKTFKIDQEFGFNKMTVKLFILDLIKTTILALIIGFPLLFSILWLMKNLGNNWWLYTWGVFVAFNLIILVIYPTIIAPLFNKFVPLDNIELRNKIEGLLNQCGFKVKGVFVMDGSKRSSHGNAYFTGLGSSKRIVFFDTLLKKLSHEEIIAVLAHELGHFKHKHIIKQMLLSSITTLIILYAFSILMNHPKLYSSLGIHYINNATGLLLLFNIIGIINLPFTPINSYLSRKNEFEADNFAKKHADKKDLINGLVKLYRDNASTLTPDKIYTNFYYSHPPASARIANLEQ